ncbi:hypothetical protein L4X63_09400 [Geomonas sp. Red32]|uniref:hypothetical protein n=1 Tax=Geomonas sp. Red32 TaxID=2912856 RepID=UPI00202CFE96|nr:hypothetical protein [Geomonas sp. Red32]MCM0081804.1 hypothetical protein [Geomonas sp. Red32]
MKEKQLKPPFYRVTAECGKCGTVRTTRKPHRLAGQRNDCGHIIPPEPREIVCPTPGCTWHAKVTSTELVEKV